MKETELAAAVVAYLRDLEWDVHQEVGGAYGARADIVAVRGALLLVVETKTTLGLSVIGQAQHWLAQANYVLVAVPRSRRFATERACAERILREWGIGLWTVTVSDWEEGQSRVREEIGPRLCRRIPCDRVARLRGMLNDGTRTYAAAGNAESKFWSPFKETLRQLQLVVHAKPGVTTRELVGEIKHHYCTDTVARSSLVRWLRWGKIPGVRAEGDRPVRWYPAA